MAFNTVSHLTPGVSAKLEIFDGAVLITDYVYTAASDTVVLSERPSNVVTNYAGIAPTIGAINTWSRQLAALFQHAPTIDNFRQEVRRTNALLRIEIGQGPTDWAAVEMARNTDVITYFARPETTLSWPRFLRWVAVQVEFIALAADG